MECPRCQTSNRESARFCRRCGTGLGRDDGAASPADPDSNFCDHCGANLAALAISHAAAEGFADAAAPQDALDAAIEGERKQVTVLFADIVGSTNLIAGLDPEEARRLLGLIIQVMKDSVHMYGGTVNQIQGDGIMALFGAPHYHEDHAVRACYAALHMHESLARTAAAADSTIDPSVRMHIGISSGEVIVGTFASDFRRDYNAAGEMIHLGARLQQLAEPGETLCASDTVRLAEGFVDAQARGLTPIRGLAAPVEIFQLVGARTARMRFHAHAAYGLSPFLGREADYETLSRRLDLARSGQGQVVALVGDAGVGKSRLIWELTHSPLTDDWQVLEAGGFSYGKNIPYLPIIALLKSIFGIEERDGETEIKARVREQLGALGGPLPESGSAILSVLGLRVDDPAWQATDPRKRRSLFSGGFVQLLRRHSEGRPLIVVVEDLHWIDNETQGLLDSLVEALATARLLLLVNYRPGFRHAWSEQPSYTEIGVTPLSDAGAQRLVWRLLGDHPSVQRLKKELVARTGGNPFFLEECIRTLAESKVLEGKPGAFRLAQHFAGAQVPASVQTVLGARIDRLSPDDKRLLQAASGLGSTFPLALLRALLPGRSLDALHAGLARLTEADLLYESRLYPELEYAFTHTLTQEVAYGSLLKERRRSLHARIVEAIESVHAQRLLEYTETLAFHALRGGVWDKAVTYARRAGQKARSQSAYQEAVTYFEQSLDAAAHLPQTDSVLEEAIDIRFELRNALFPLGKVGRDLDHLRHAERLGAKLQDKRRLAWTSAYIARDLSLLGDPDEALVAGRDALSLAGDLGDADLQMLTSAYIGQAHYALGNYRQSAEIMAEQVSAIREDIGRQHFGLPGPGAIFFRAWLIWALARLGDFAEAEAQTREMLRIAEATDQPLSLTVAHYSHGFLCVHRGDFEQAVSILERCLEFCRTWGFPAWFTNIASSLGYACARSGRLEEGMDLLQQAIDQTRSIGIMVSHANEVFWRAEAGLLAGRAEEAAALAREAVELARRFKERGNEADALCLSGEIALAIPSLDVAAAEDSFRKGLALAEACGMQPTIARCRAGLEALDRAAGRPEGSAAWRSQGRGG